MRSEMEGRVKGGGERRMMVGQENKMSGDWTGEI